MALTEELVRAVEDALCLLEGRLDLFDLPIRLFTEPPGLLDELTPTRNGPHRLTQFGSIRQPVVVTHVSHRSRTHPLSGRSMSVSLD